MGERPARSWLERGKGLTDGFGCFLDLFFFLCWDSLESFPAHSLQLGAWVDFNGCSQVQMDSDLDGKCNADRPLVLSGTLKGQYVQTNNSWCGGADNCKYVGAPARSSPVTHHSCSPHCPPCRTQHAALTSQHQTNEYRKQAGAVG